MVSRESNRKTATFVPRALPNCPATASNIATSNKGSSRTRGSNWVVRNPIRANPAVGSIRSETASNGRSVLMREMMGETPATASLALSAMRRVPRSTGHRPAVSGRFRVCWFRAFALRRAVLVIAMMSPRYLSVAGCPFCRRAIGWVPGAGEPALFGSPACTAAWCGLLLGDGVA